MCSFYSFPKHRTLGQGSPGHGQHRPRSRQAPSDARWESCPWVSQSSARLSDKWPRAKWAAILIPSDSLNPRPHARGPEVTEEWAQAGTPSRHPPAPGSGSQTRHAGPRPSAPGSLGWSQVWGLCGLAPPGALRLAPDPTAPLRQVFWLLPFQPSKNFYFPNTCLLSKIMIKLVG